MFHRINLLQICDTLECLKAIEHFGGKGERIFQVFLRKLPIIQQLVEVLDIPFKVTKTLQSQTFALSDFYGLWLDMSLKLNMVENKEFGTLLKQKLEDRKSQLIDHPAMLCALFLDPRYNCQLTNEQKVEARKLVKSFWFRYKSIKSNTANGEIVDNVDYLEQYFVAQGHQPAFREMNKTGASFNIPDSEFDSQIDKFEQHVPRLHHKCSIIDFWTGRLTASKSIETLFELRELAINILSFPPTQVPCERSFSGLTFIFNCRRSNLEQKTLESILLIRENIALWKEVKREDCTKLS